jgi:catechol 2,3-dioxygenase-like lactoylglutathione lyase family enzyme
MDHIVIGVQEIDRTARFYEIFLSKPIHRDNESVAFQIGETKLFFVLTSGEFIKTDKDRGGLNHLAFGVRTTAELRALEETLNSAHITNSGVKTDPYGNKPFVWFDDPDGYRLEFYCPPDGARSVWYNRNLGPVAQMYRAAVS